MDQIKGFIAEEKALEFYNGKALLNLQFEFLIVSDAGVESAYDFDGYVSAYFRVYDERDGQLIKNFSNQIIRTSNFLIFNCSVADMTFEDLGKYWFELGYNNSGYEVALRYSKLTIL